MRWVDALVARVLSYGFFRKRVRGQTIVYKKGSTTVTFTGWTEREAEEFMWIVFKKPKEKP